MTADAQVRAVLDVIAPTIDPDVAAALGITEMLRNPLILVEYEGRPVHPNDDQLRALAEQIVTAIRTASGPPLTPEQVAAVLPVLRGRYSSQHDEATEAACLALAELIEAPGGGG